MVSLRHRAYANFVIIDLSNWMVIVALRCCRFAREIDDLKREILHEFHVGPLFLVTVDRVDHIDAF
jgi:hypothetical protein